MYILHYGRFATMNSLLLWKPRKIFADLWRNKMMRRRKMLALLVAVGVGCLSWPGTSAAQITPMIRYQGTLTDSAGVLMDGTYTLTFRFYDAATSGEKLWEEVQTGVPVTRGAFSVLLGSITPLNLRFSANCWLAICVNSGAELAPRHRIASVPNAYLSDKAEAVVDYSCRVCHMQADQSIANATETALSFDTELWDADNIHDVATNNTRLICRTAGKYYIFGAVRMTPNANGYRSIAIQVNGTKFCALERRLPVSDLATTITIGTYYPLKSGDYVELVACQTSGVPFKAN